MLIATIDMMKIYNEDMVLAFTKEQIVCQNVRYHQNY